MPPVAGLGRAGIKAAILNNLRRESGAPTTRVTMKLTEDPTELTRLTGRELDDGTWLSGRSLIVVREGALTERHLRALTQDVAVFAKRETQARSVLARMEQVRLVPRAAGNRHAVVVLLPRDPAQGVWEHVATLVPDYGGPQPGPMPVVVHFVDSGETLRRVVAAVQVAATYLFDLEPA